ncbi:type 2 lanthipeptide synthetase LanM family protein [Micromonospora peucetia]|uniref:type 2 lanthipeptide synthetase LanM family protein n=1 Tax=Micromonospora peucetia TaxID=47871 RepID=UPI002251C6A6|nr:type 2 lanthipeptide synthetase LanM family protein [Micromonospora peucetia]MCX4388031.1 type 2 lanthipeptide synthetase LanM family protein [Micromonospora peucetia]
MDRSGTRDTAAVSGAGSAWWAPGRTLAERVRAADHGGPVAADPVSEHAMRRLRDWRSAYELGATGQFANRLAALGITERQFLALLDRPPAALANGSGAPGWAEFTERALGIAPDGARHLPPDTPWSDAFAGVLAPFVTAACADLRQRVRTPGMSVVADLDAVYAGFADALRVRLVAMASRTFVLELNVARAAGRLAGPTPEHRFAAFVADLAQRERLTRVMTDYPVLARLLATACRHAVEATAELLDRFVADRAEILGRLLDGRDPGPLAGFDVAGDSHGHGRAVAILRFGSGARVIYRPRSVAVHVHFNEVLDWLNGLLPELELRTLTVLARDGYGWIEAVDRAACADVGQVGAFYRRQGVLLALLYLLGMTDIHHENLIACADQPVLVDVETLMHPDLPVPTAAPDPAARALRTSVYRTALLPQPLIGERGLLDISGLGGDPGAQQLRETVAWAAAGTDTMHLVRRSAPVRAAENRPTLDGVPADAAEYTAELLAGFRAAYRAIARRAGDLIGPDGLLRRFAADELRVIVRSTRTYTVLLSESTHPDVLRDALDRDQIFDLLWAASVDDPVRNRLVSREIEQLWAGDVPLFTCCPDDRDLTGGDGVGFVDVLDEPVLATAQRKIASMGVIDQRDQEWIVQAALAGRLGGARHECAEPVSVRWEATAPDPGRLLTVACGIADKIIADAYDDGVFANWLGLEPVDGGHSTIMPLGAGLGNGYPGTALFLAELARLTDVDRYAEAAGRAVRQLPVLLTALDARPHLASTIGSGGFTGLGGIAYAAARLADLLQDDALGDSVERAVRLAAIAATTETNLGVLDGLAGCLAAMLAVSDLTGLPLAAATARDCAQRLLAAGSSLPAQPGFATGTAGIGWALLRFAQVGGDERHAEAGSAMLARAATGPIPGPSTHSWCHGVPGIAVAIADQRRLLADPALAAFVDRAATAVSQTGLVSDHSLCHGEMGRQEMLSVAAARGRRAAVSVRFDQAGQLVAALDQAGPRCGAAGDVSVAGLLDGLAGIGHGLLRIGFADHVPSALLLHAEPTTSGRGVEN